MIPARTRPGRRVRVALVTSMIVLAFGAVGAWMVVDALDSGRAATVDRAHQVVHDARELDAVFGDRIAGTRGYLLSGDPEFLDERRVAIEAFAALLDRLRGERVLGDGRLARIEACSARSTAPRRTRSRCDPSTGTARSTRGSGAPAPARPRSRPRSAPWPISPTSISTARAPPPPPPRGAAA